MSKNYQITQYEIPIGESGKIKIGNKNIGITESSSLEEDPASLVHLGGIAKAPYVLVDYNRSGNPLCEIVTEPDMNSPEEASDFLKSLITILRYLDIFDPEKNIIKADANVSIKETGYIRSEIKNITGFKEIERALNYEIERQKHVKKLVQETRSWNAEKGITTLLRKKETEEDYGYIFDPDLVPIEINNKWLAELKKQIPKLPIEHPQITYPESVLRPRQAPQPLDSATTQRHRLVPEVLLQRRLDRGALGGLEPPEVLHRLRGEDDIEWHSGQIIARTSKLSYSSALTFELSGLRRRAA